MMMNWIKYLLEANLYLVLLYAVYYLVLRRETFYQLNRAYLLTACVVAFAIPLMQISRLRPAPVLAPVNDVEAVIVNPAPLQQVPVEPLHTWTADEYYILVYGVVAATMLIIFGLKIVKLIKLARKANIADGFHLVEIDDDNNAFSFFSYLFIGSKLSASDTILRHELVHIRQKHSLDIIFLELFKIINWFNPVVYLMQNSMKELHEFIADRETAQQQDVNQYTDFLVNNAYGFAPEVITNNFFNKNLLKNRIMMLHQKRSGSLARLKLLVILPLLAGMLCLSTLAFTKDYAVIDLAPVPVVKATEPVGKTAAKNKLMFIIDPAKYTYKQIAKISQKLSEHGYSLSYSEKHKGTDSAMLGFAIKITDENRHTGASAEFRVADMIKGGYVIELGVNDDDKVRVHSKAKAGAKIDPTVPLPPSFPAPVKKLAQVTPAPPPLPAVISVTKTGYKTKTHGYVIDGKTEYRVIITEKSGEDKIYYRNKATTEEMKQLRDKYGYTFPSGDVKPVPLPPPPPPALGAPVTTPNPPESMTYNGDDFKDLYQQLAKGIRYPTAARENNIQGKVIVTFNVDANHQVTNIGVLRWLTNDINNEVVRALKNCKMPDAAQQNVNYIVPIAFAVVDKSTGNYVDGKTDPNMGLENPHIDHQSTGFASENLSEVVIISYKQKPDLKGAIAPAKLNPQNSTDKIPSFAAGETFKPNTPQPYSKLSITDRWGHHVFTSNSVNASWDGTKNNKPQETGTYYWIANSVKDGAPYVYKGYVIFLAKA